MDSSSWSCLIRCQKIWVGSCALLAPFQRALWSWFRFYWRQICTTICSNIASRDFIRRIKTSIRQSWSRTSSRPTQKQTFSFCLIVKRIDTKNRDLLSDLYRSGTILEFHQGRPLVLGWPRCEGKHSFRASIWKEWPCTAFNHFLIHLLDLLAQTLSFFSSLVS